MLFQKSIGLVVMGDDSCLKGRGFESWHCVLDGHFFTLICCKNCIVCLKKTENKLKRPGLAHKKRKKSFKTLATDHLSLK